MDVENGLFAPLWGNQAKPERCGPGFFPSDAAQGQHDMRRRLLDLPIGWGYSHARVDRWLLENSFETVTSFPNPPYPRDAGGYTIQILRTNAVCIAQ